MFNFQTYTNLQNMRKWVMGILLMLIGASVFAQNNFCTKQQGTGFGKCD